MVKFTQTIKYSAYVPQNYYFFDLQKESLTLKIGPFFRKSSSIPEEYQQLTKKF